MSWLKMKLPELPLSDVALEPKVQEVHDQVLENQLFTI